MSANNNSGRSYNTMRSSKLKGTFVAVYTPFLHDSLDSPVDEQKLSNHLEQLIDAGVTGIVACGTTAQSSALSHQEHVELACIVARLIKGRVSLIVGSGSNSTNEAIELSLRIEERVAKEGYHNGVTLLHVTGYYNCPPQNGLVKHFTSVAESLKLPDSDIVIYNVPSRTANNVQPETLAILADHPKIIGVKEVAGLESAWKTVCYTTGKDFAVTCGEDSLLAPMLELGAIGTISAAGNVAPKMFVDLVNGFFAGLVEGDFTVSRALQLRLTEILKLVYLERNPIPLAHIFNSEVRSPLCKSEHVEKVFRNILTKFTSEELGIKIV
jgi:4-hydroxy-tetrahydrodipicolinate synthase